MKRIAIAALAAATLAGCSSLPVDESAARVPADRIYNEGLLVRATDSDGQIVFLRDWGFGGGGCIENLYVDGELAFAIGANEQLPIYLRPGHHFFRVEHRAAICPSVQASQETTLDATSKQVYRIQLPGTGGILLTRIQ